MTNQRINYLLDQCIRGLCTEAEKEELSSLIRQAKNDDNIKRHMEKTWASLSEEYKLNDIQSVKILSAILDKEPVVHYMFPWKRIAAAAAIIILMGAGTYFLFRDKGKKEIVKTNNNTPQNIDLPPGGNKAVLTLADNRTIVLDNVSNGTIAEQGNTKVLKLKDGQIAYDVSDQKHAEVLYNTITTPRGGQYQLTLSDGSKVWLNAASSIRFPTTFAGNQRKVEITGEAYFEVAKNAAMPFKVEVNGMQEVEVLGTHFNINAYLDESTINTTLLEGSVKVTSLMNHDQQLLLPGEQAQLTPDGQIYINKTVDVSEVIAWKNGQFVFDSADVKSIMRQVSRWYNVDIIYEGKISKETYSGIVSRNNNVSEVLKIMEQGGLMFRIEGSTLAGGVGKITVLE